MDDGFGVRGGLEDGALLHQLFAQAARIGEIAVMGDREPAARQIGKHRLDIARSRTAGGGIAHMADSVGARASARVAVLAENIADQAEMALSGEMRAVEGDDTGRFLPAMLKRMQTQRGQRRRIRVAENAEDAALFMQLVGFEMRVVIAGSSSRPRWPR